jgi:hypothetical protein
MNTEYFLDINFWISKLIDLGLKSSTTVRYPKTLTWRIALTTVSTQTDFSNATL